MCKCISSDIVVGLEMMEYTVEENVGSVEVCARITSPPDSQLLPRSFMLIANTLGLTASKILSWCSLQVRNLSYFLSMHTCIAMNIGYSEQCCIHVCTYIHVYIYIYV